MSNGHDPDASQAVPHAARDAPARPEDATPLLPQPNCQRTRCCPCRPTPGRPNTPCGAWPVQRIRRSFVFIPDLARPVKALQACPRQYFLYDAPRGLSADALIVRPPRRHHKPGRALDVWLLAAAAADPTLIIRPCARAASRAPRPEKCGDSPVPNPPDGRAAREGRILVHRLRAN